MGSPQASSSVGAKSSKVMGCMSRPPESKPGPWRAVGMRTEDSWQLRLYSPGATVVVTHQHRHEPGDATATDVF